jgi:hypothetical protein
MIILGILLLIIGFVAGIAIVLVDRSDRVRDRPGPLDPRGTGPRRRRPTSLLLALTCDRWLVPPRRSSPRPRSG